MAAPTTDALPDTTKDAWMVRPCELYNAEYKDCTSIAGRFQQYFVYGSTIDCGQWKKDFDNCMTWRKDEDKKSLVDVINSEKVRRHIRYQGMMANDTWELRTEPLSSEEWTRPLPDYLSKNHDTSYLHIVKTNAAAAAAVDETKSANSFCSIS